MDRDVRDLETGALIDGRFRIDGKIGEGGQGVVYRVLDLNTDRARAMKLLDAAPGDADSHARFQREGRLGLNLRHPNLVEVYETDKRLRGVPYFVMELLDGMLPLAQCWGQLDWPRFLVIVEQVASALDHLAEYDLVHRDLSPWNILVGVGDQVKVIDLGLAREAGSSLTRTSMVDVMGSPGYLPPEQLERAKGVEAQSDQWALAAIVYEAATGIPPYYDATEEDEGDVGALQRMADGVPLRLPSELNVAFGPEFDRALFQALESRPGQRYRTSRDFVIAIKRAAPRAKLGIVG
jgi:serine/threonine-protein kinase